MRRFLHRGTLPGALALLVAFTGTTLCAGNNLIAQSAPANAAIPLPPMGWSSWNSFSNTVDSQIVMDQAKAMISTGMAKAGYQYVNIDEGWWLGRARRRRQLRCRSQGLAGAGSRRARGRHGQHRPLHSRPGPEGRHLHRRRI